jgi:phosphoglycerol geranylgeranyltransferase
MTKFDFSSSRQLAVLIDPDKADRAFLDHVIRYSKEKVNLFLVGGSLLNNDNFEKTILHLKENSSIPVYVFPGNMLQVSSKADGILLLSLISGRNPEFLIGHHVVSAMAIKRAKIDVFSTGYILLDGGSVSSVEYMSNTKPIPANKSDIVAATALAGEQLGMKAIYLEAGSGAKNKVMAEIIKNVKQNIDIPIIVGGGVSSALDVYEAFDAGANLVVMGTAIENDPSILENFPKR